MSASDKKKIRREQNAGPLTEKQKQARKEARSVRVRDPGAEHRGRYIGGA